MPPREITFSERELAHFEYSFLVNLGWSPESYYSKTGTSTDPLLILLLLPLAFSGLRFWPDMKYWSGTMFSSPSPDVWTRYSDTVYLIGVSLFAWVISRLLGSTSTTEDDFTFMDALSRICWMSLPILHMSYIKFSCFSATLLRPYIFIILINILIIMRRK